MKKIKSKVWRKLRKATADYKVGKNISPAFSSAKRAIDYLNPKEDLKS